MVDEKINISEDIDIYKKLTEEFRSKNEEFKKTSGGAWCWSDWNGYGVKVALTFKPRLGV